MDEGVFWWVIVPYITLAIMIFGSLYRFAFRQLSWVAPSTEIFEKRWLRLGSPLFHYGLLFAFIGHVMGILIPIEFYHALGISDHMYHFLAIWGGGLAGLMVVVGAVILLIRKIVIDPVRVHATFADYFSVISLIIVAGLGVYMTLIYNTTVIEYEYRTTIGPWFRSLFTFQPEYKLMLTVPPIFQIHVITALLLFAAIPFTKLVHFYSLPLGYLHRAPQQYRSRAGFRRKGLE
ncbi:respiratory nitrate reductase subunit gamma [Virgibacillus sp. MSP4-1]|uniref:respiratory nitrate reductase subunit gamma n=1 Tax=Virgibacillus sp. MSP4-1 TaxID=2700081 RepID=UPI00039CADE7|nr:respiratory nitrate reductase subunit gamma [Virgibacillus sp. MSP4-1]QHS22465.1 respiratory nitrate reductase subunit gamma [Virgibacillus sp. MSP4-1]